EIEKVTGHDCSREPTLFQAVRNAVIRAKHDLSESDRTTITIDLPGSSSYQRELTRDEFNRSIADLVQRTLERGKKALADADLDPRQIDEVVMVGGSTR